MKILVHLHIFYYNQLKDFISKISKFTEHDIDLFVTYVQVPNLTFEKGIIYSAFPNAHIEEVPNRGYDVYPFLKVINSVNLDRYDAILKLHSKGQKKGKYFFNWNYPCKKISWREGLLAPLISTPEVFNRNLKLLGNGVNMVASGPFIVNRVGFSCKGVREELQHLGKHQIKSFEFVAGTIFLASPSIFKSLPFYDECYFPVPIIGTEDISHVYERIFGFLACDNGGSIKACDYDYSKFLYKLTNRDLALRWLNFCRYMFLYKLKIITKTKFKDKYLHYIKIKQMAKHINSK